MPLSRSDHALATSVRRQSRSICGRRPISAVPYHGMYLRSHAAAAFCPVKMGTKSVPAHDNEWQGGFFPLLPQSFHTFIFSRLSRLFLEGHNLMLFDFPCIQAKGVFLEAHDLMHQHGFCWVFSFGCRESAQAHHSQHLVVSIPNMSP
jgi:hypothetical protein